MIRDWVKAALSDNGQPSSSRALAAVCTLVSLVWGTYLVLHKGEWPDATSLAGMAAFNTSHYFVNRATKAYENANGKNS
jgi:hypothetical protein